jgi:hypothetical protein
VHVQVWFDLSVYHIKNQQDATLAVLFIGNCKITLYVSDTLCPSSRVLKTVVIATGACHGSGWYISSKDPKVGCLLHYVIAYLGINRLWHGAIHNRPLTLLLDIHHPNPWHEPVAVTTVFSTPDDGHRVSETCRMILQLLINSTAKVASCWFFI